VLPYVDPRYVGCAYVHDLAAVLAGDAKLARLLEAAGRFGAFEKLTFSSQSAALVEIGLALRDFRGEA
jgi:hypothetical protein